MRNIVDQRIAAMAEREELELPKSYLDRIEKTLLNLPEKNRVIKLNRQGFKPAAALLTGTILVSSVTVFATNNLLRERLESMTVWERNAYIEQINSADVDSYSRELTQMESKRMQRLKCSYEQEGRFPEKELIQVNTKQQVKEDAVVFVIEESKFYLPDREMTDEELLEIIDFYCKRDFSILQKMSLDDQTKTTGEECVHEGGITKKEASRIAQKMAVEIYSVELKQYKTTVVYDQNREYRVDMTGRKNADTFHIVVDGDSSKVVEIEHVQKRENTASGIAVNKERYKQIYQELCKHLFYKMNSDGKIKNSYCDYSIDSEGRLYKGTVSYIFKMSNQECCVMKYSCSNHDVFDIFITNYQSYQKEMNINAEKRRDRGIIKERIPLE